MGGVNVRETKAGGVVEPPKKRGGVSYPFSSYHLALAYGDVVGARTNGPNVIEDD